MAVKQLRVSKMKRLEVESDGESAEVNSSPSPPPPPPPPPPLPPVPRFLRTRKPGAKFTESVTKQEIAKYWRRKRMVEEDHFNAAIKAAARLRARNLSEEDYKCFEESLNEEVDLTITKTSDHIHHSSREIRVGIKDWWTKSKYAYLNQPAIKSMDKPTRRASTFISQFHCYKAAPPPTTTTTTFGIC